jgi:hypothetical protein
MTFAKFQKRRYIEYKVGVSKKIDKPIKPRKPEKK